MCVHLPVCVHVRAQQRLDCTCDAVGRKEGGVGLRVGWLRLVGQHRLGEIVVIVI